MATELQALDGKRVKYAYTSERAIFARDAHKFTHSELLDRATGGVNVGDKHIDGVASIVEHCPWVDLTRTLNYAPAHMINHGIGDNLLDSMFENGKKPCPLHRVPNTARGYIDKAGEFIITVTGMTMPQ